MAEVSVRTLEEEDWADYRRLRLASLESDPEAFVATFDQEQAYPEERWRSRLRRSRRLVASRDHHDLGVVSVGAARDVEDAEEGVAELFGMWVTPDARGSGVAWQLVTAAADQALHDGYRHLRLWVSTDNGRAVSFYSSYGFRPADERRPMRTDASVDEVAMTLALG